MDYENITQDCPKLSFLYLAYMLNYYKDET
ncbi:MAG: hypothetical protein HW399_622, partial [Dehalococcoidia bacterium]|nr:hypothetical protein [Dehalococcoidia bacterium]